MALTNEQWKAVADEMVDGSYGCVDFELDGRKLSLRKCFVAENRLAIMVYIDGTITPLWGDPTHSHHDPFVVKIWRKRTISHYSPSKKKELIKSVGKRAAKKYFPNIDKKFIWYCGDFSSFKTMKSQYSKLKELKLVKVGYKKMEVSDAS